MKPLLSCVEIRLAVHFSAPEKYEAFDRWLFRPADSVDEVMAALKDILNLK